MDIKPQAMALPKDTSTLPQGKYGPIFPKTPACYGFTIIAKIIPGREPVFYEYGENIEKAVAAMPNCLAPLQLHYLKWVLFPIDGVTYFMYSGIFDTSEFTRALVNSIGIALISTFVAVVFASMAAYAVARLERTTPSQARSLGAVERAHLRTVMTPIIGVPKLPSSNSVSSAWHQLARSSLTV